MADKSLTEAEFRETLADVLAAVTRLAPVCSSLEDLTEVCQLALENDGQLRLLMNLVVKKK